MVDSRSAAPGLERSSLPAQLASALGPPLVFFVALPLLVYALNLESVEVSKRVIFESGLVATAVATSGLWLLARLPRIGRPLGAGYDVLTVTLFLLLLVPNRTGELTGLDHRLATSGSAVPLLKLGVLLGLGALAWRFAPQQLKALAQSIVATTAAAAAIVALFASSAADRSRAGTDEEVRRLVALGKRSNVVVLVLDGFTGYRMVEIVESMPEVRAAFDGFTLYPRAIASAHNTPAGSSTLLTGDLRLAIEVEDKVERNTRSLESSFLAEARARGWEATYISDLRVRDASVPSVDQGFLLPPDRLPLAARAHRYFDFLAASSARVLPERAARAGERLASRAFPARATTIEGERDLLARAANDAERNPLKGKLAFDRLLAALDVGDHESKVLFVFSTMPHPPWNFTESGRFERGANSRRTAVFVARQVVRLLERLREIRALDDALVVVTADHGGLAIADASMGGVFGTGPPLPRELNPLIMVKPPHADQPLRISEMTVWLGDVAATVRDALELPQPEQPLFASRSLLDPESAREGFTLPIFFRPNRVSFHAQLAKWVRVDARGTFAEFGQAAAITPAALLSGDATIAVRAGRDKFGTKGPPRSGAWIEIDGRQVAKVLHAGAVTLSDAGGELRVRRFEEGRRAIPFIVNSEQRGNSFVAALGVPRRLVSTYLDDSAPAADGDEPVNCVFVVSARSHPSSASRCGPGDVEVEVEWR